MEKKPSAKLMSLLLVLAAMIWGAAFVAQSEGTKYVGACTFVCTRYILSAAILIPPGLLAGQKGEKKNPDGSAPEKSDRNGGWLISADFVL